MSIFGLVSLFHLNFINFIATIDKMKLMSIITVGDALHGSVARRNPNIVKHKNVAAVSTLPQHR